MFQSSFFMVILQFFTVLSLFSVFSNSFGFSVTSYFFNPSILDVIPWIRVFSAGMIIDNGQTMNVNDITFQNLESEGDGGSIYNKGTLNITNSTFNNNGFYNPLVEVEGKGAAIYNEGVLNIKDTTFSNNMARIYTGLGGAIYSKSDVTVEAINSAVLFLSNAASLGSDIYMAGTSDNRIKLSLSVKPYIQYGVGVQKRCGERFTGFFQAMFCNGGRNGVALSLGFRWAIGKNHNSNQKDKANNKTSNKIIKKATKNTVKRPTKFGKFIANTNGDPTYVVTVRK